MEKKAKLTMFDDDTVKWMHDGKLCCLHVQGDNDALNPRKDWDNLGVMACWHRRYNLGDDIGDKEPEDFWRRLVRENVPEEEILKTALDGKLPGIRLAKNDGDPETFDIYETAEYRTVLGNDGPKEYLEYEGIEKGWVVSYLMDDLTIRHCMILVEPYVAWMTLWLYDHSGITMSCGEGNPFSCPWDSGQVGWIVMSKSKVMAECGSEYVLDENGERIMVEHKHEGGNSTWSYLTRPLTDATWRKRALEIMRGEVEVYDQYLTGDVYGFTLYTADLVEDEDEEPDWQEDDSCWGFFGDDIISSGMADHVGNGLLEAIEAKEYETGKAQLHTRSYYTF